MSNNFRFRIVISCSLFSFILWHFAFVIAQTMYFVKFDCRFLLAVVPLFLTVQFVDCKKQKDLQIVVKHKPEDCSVVAEDGDQVAVHYTGVLDSGQVFDSSVQQKREPLKFVLGQNRVIPGWEQGIKGMCVGEKRTLVIPPHLAYGKKGHPPVIPESATLTFETELMELNKPGFERIEQRALQLLQFLALPAFGAYVIYYLYAKYRQESADVKSKDARKKKRK